MGQSDSTKMPHALRSLVKPAVLLVSLIALLVLVISVALSSCSSSHSKEDDSIAHGLQYLEQLAARDVNAVRANITTFRRQDTFEKVQSGELPVWSLFQGCVFFGDSRTVGIWTYQFLDISQVLADGGWTIIDLRAHSDELAQMNPEYLFLCTGVNDVGLGEWPTPEEYAQAYKDVIAELKAKMPSTKIVVNSIVPVGSQAFARNPAWEQIPQYNDAVRSMCKANEIAYVDNNQISAQDYDFMYAEDGIHYSTPFYDDWATNMAGALDL